MITVVVVWSALVCLSAKQNNNYKANHFSRKTPSLCCERALHSGCLPPLTALYRAAALPRPRDRYSL